MSDKQDRLLFWQLIGIGSFNIVDYLLTLEFLDIGFNEANPIIANIIGTYEFPLVKLFLVPLLLIVIWQHNDKIGNKTSRLYWIPFAGYYSLMVYYWFLIVAF
jgi:hypothetical protein